MMKNRQWFGKTSKGRMLGLQWRIRDFKKREVVGGNYIVGVF